LCNLDAHGPEFWGARSLRHFKLQISVRVVPSLGGSPVLFRLGGLSAVL